MFTHASNPRSLLQPEAFGLSQPLYRLHHLSPKSSSSCRVSRSTTSGGRLDLGFCNCLTAAAPAFVSRTGSIPTNPTHADTARSERRDSRNSRLDDGELDAPLAADQFDASDETLIRRFRELTADDFAEGLAVAVAEAERNRDEGTAE